MIQQLYPSVAHPYSFELNKDFNFSAAHLQNCDNQPECVQVYLRETPTSYVVYRPKEYK